MLRESFAEQFIEWNSKSDKAFLIRPVERIRNIVIGHDTKSIQLGNRILLEKDDTVIFILKQKQQAFVSVSTFDGKNLIEYFSETIYCSEKETEYKIVHRIYMDMNTPEIYEVN